MYAVWWWRERVEQVDELSRVSESQSLRVSTAYTTSNEEQDPWHSLQARARKSKHHSPLLLLRLPVSSSVFPRPPQNPKAQSLNRLPGWRCAGMESSDDSPDSPVAVLHVPMSSILPGNMALTPLSGLLACVLDPAQAPAQTPVSHNMQPAHTDHGRQPQVRPSSINPSTPRLSVVGSVPGPNLLIHGSG